MYTYTMRFVIDIYQEITMRWILNDVINNEFRLVKIIPGVTRDIYGRNEIIYQFQNFNGIQVL